MFDLFRSRDKAVRAFLVFLLAIVALSMITYLIPQTGAGTTVGDQAVVAKIGSETITAQEVTKAISRFTQNQKVPAQMLAYYAPQVIQQLIDSRVVAWKAADMGISVSSDEAENALIDSLPPDAVKNGKVDSATLAAVLQNMGVTLSEMKENSARGLAVNRLEDIISAGVVVTNQEVEKEYHDKNDKAKIAYAVVVASAYEKDGQATDAEVQSWYDSHKQTYQVPDKRSVAVVQIDPVKVGAGIQVTDAQLRAAYNDRQADFQTPERVQARHILLKSDATNDAEIKAKAADLLKTVKAGGDFAKLAKDKSEDTGSAANGGELGWIVRGQTVAEFERAAFTMKPGEISDLVKTQYGYHIIQVETHEQARLQPLEEVKAELVASIQKQAASQLVQNLAEKAIAALRQDPTHPEKAAQAVGGTSVQLGDVTNPLPGIGMVKELGEAVAGLKKGEVTLGPVQAGNGLVLVAVVSEFVAAHQGTLDEVRAQVKEAATKSKTLNMAYSKADELVAKAQSMGGDLEKAAKAMNMTVKASNDIGRSDPIEGVGSAGAFPDIFRKPVGTVLAPSAIPDGKMVAKVLAFTPADSAALAGQRAKIVSDLRTKKAEERAKVFQQGLRQSMTASGKLKVNQDVVDRILATYKQAS